MSTEVGPTEPGWFTDPRPKTAGVRWWDGAAWTPWVADGPDASPPPASQPEEPEAQVSTPVAVLLTVVVVVLALLAVGATVTFTQREYVRGAAAAPPSAPHTSAVTYLADQRKVVVDELSIVQPAGAWHCASKAEKVEPYFSRVISCEILVHKNYYSNIAVGLLDPALSGDDLRETSQKAFDTIRDQAFTGGSLTLRRTDDAPYGSGDQAVAVTSRLRFTGKDGTQYDDLRLLVVQLASGSYAAVFSNVPNDLPAAAKLALQQSTDTLTVRG